MLAAGSPEHEFENMAKMGSVRAFSPLVRLMLSSARSRLLELVEVSSERVMETVRCFAVGHCKIRVTAETLLLENEMMFRHIRRDSQGPFVDDFVQEFRPTDISCV